ncbi:(R)-citramalate synthase [bacterium HR17]|uniref:Citramalate synthase n=1 Tax=Candidatus Fervidibacter japonicus TaxID=2035412 RepID=A0A2H5X9K6_9BACT|nr:(R)-citramalate synthase [bacterium HR17]
MPRPERVFLYDTTLRDGAQAEGVNFSLEDKMKIARKLDEFGVHYIEAGWPGSNPKDEEFFRWARDAEWQQAKLVAFSMTRRKGILAEDDTNIRTLLECGTPVVAIVGKSWDLHVTEALNASLDENLRMIEDTVRLAKRVGKEVVYDAEHFFDGYKHNPTYAVETILAAQEAGADWIVFCDTNGGSLPHEVERVLAEVAPRLRVPFGIHTHNDSDAAVANALVAVLQGATQVQGTINGIGERAGNCNLISVIANLELKLGVHCVGRERLQRLAELSYFVSEVANLVPNDKQPFVGKSVFAHKGGMHSDAVMKRPETYEHIPPDWVGNKRRILVSELAGRAAVVAKAAEFGIHLDKRSPEVTHIINEIKRKERTGYEYEGADASLELLIRKHLGLRRKFFELVNFTVLVTHRNGDITAEAKVKVRVGDEELVTAAEGNGPVHALDLALRKALESVYPELKSVRLTDYKVRVVNSDAATGARVRVLIESRDETGAWTTIGVSPNIIEASLIALLDSLEYGLLRKLGAPVLSMPAATPASQ